MLLLLLLLLLLPRLTRAAHRTRRPRLRLAKVSSAAVSRGESNSPSRDFRLRRGRAGELATVCLAAAPRAARAETGSTVEKPFLLGPSSRRSVTWSGLGFGLGLVLGLESGLWVGVGVGARAEPHQTLAAAVAPAEDGAAQQPHGDSEPARDDGEDDHLDGTHLWLGLGFGSGLGFGVGLGLGLGLGSGLELGLGVRR